MKRLFPDHGPDGDYDQFVWHTAAGELTTPAQMTTTHLFWSARMVFNHTVAEPLRLNPFRVWTDVFSWSCEDREEAHTAFMAEIARRPKKDLTVEQRAEVEHMRRNHAAFDDALKEPPLPRGSLGDEDQDDLDPDNEWDPFGPLNDDLFH